MDKAAYKRFAFDPSIADAELYAKQCDLLLLALIGLVAVGHGTWAKIKYPEDDENFLLAANRLQMFCPDVSFEEVRSAVPKAEGPSANIDQAHADTVCEALVNLLQGRPVSIDMLPDIHDSRVHARIPATPAEGEGEAERGSPSQELEPAPAVLTQVNAENPENSDEEAPAKKLREEVLGVPQLQQHREAMIKILVWVLKQKNHTLPQWRMNEKAKDVHPEKSWEVAAKVTKLLVSSSLARQTPGKPNSFDLAKVPQEHVVTVSNALQEVGVLKPVDVQKGKEQLSKRQAADVYDEQKFTEWMKICAAGFKVE
eukprot:Skav209048  [mRNA]  locus=scaffold2483:165932:166870:- [translate_table: standard]